MMRTKHLACHTVWSRWYTEQCLLVFRLRLTCTGTGTGTEKECCVVEVVQFVPCAFLPQHVEDSGFLHAFRDKPVRMGYRFSYLVVHHGCSTVSMNGAGAPQPRALASMLLHGTDRASNGHNSNVSGFLVCAQLGASLTTLTGAAGFCSLLTRALVLAQADVPWLLRITVQPNGTLIRLDGTVEGIDHAEQVRGEISLVTHLLELLYLFIGETLTLQLVKQACPSLQLAETAPTAETAT
jgi:hypothetical protein